MTVGLGSGTTSSLVIRCLGERIQREGLSIVGTASSEASSDLARSAGIPLSNSTTSQGWTSTSTGRTRSIPSSG